jgi:hypothetical protein
MIATPWADERETPDESRLRELLGSPNPHRSARSNTGPDAIGASDAIVVEGLAKRYPNGVEAVRGISFGVGTGEVYGMLGPNAPGSRRRSASWGRSCARQPAAPPRAGVARRGWSGVTGREDDLRARRDADAVERVVRGGDDPDHPDRMDRVHVARLPECGGQVETRRRQVAMGPVVVERLEHPDADTGAVPAGESPRRVGADPHRRVVQILLEESGRVVDPADRVFDDALDLRELDEGQCRESIGEQLGGRVDRLRVVRNLDGEAQRGVGDRLARVRVGGLVPDALQLIDRHRRDDRTERDEA